MFPQWFLGRENGKRAVSLLKKKNQGVNAKLPPPKVIWIFDVISEWYIKAVVGVQSSRETLIHQCDMQSLQTGLFSLTDQALSCDVDL